MARAWFDPVAVKNAKDALARGQVDRDTLALAHLPLAVAAARGAAWRMEAVEHLHDWIQEAALAMLEAAADYLHQGGDPDGFQQYASSVIHYRLIRAKRKSLPVSVPKTTYHTLLPAYQKLAKEASETGQVLTDEFVAEKLGISVQRAIDARLAWQAAFQTPRALDDRLAGRDEEDAPTLADTVPDETVDVEAEALAAVEREERQELWQAIGDLRRSHQIALGLNMGAATFEFATIAEIEQAAHHSMQNRARHALARVFREGRRNARRLGFLPDDATGRQPLGRRVVNLVSGRRGSARVRSGSSGARLGRCVAGGDQEGAPGARVS